jgi:hypothetical protein
MAKIKYIPPKKSVNFLTKLETTRVPNRKGDYVSIITAICDSIEILTTHKVKDEAIRTLLCVFALNSSRVLENSRLIDVGIEQVNSLDICSTVACSNKLHRLAGKKLLVENHNDPKRVYFKLSNLSENLINGYLQNILF